MTPIQPRSAIGKEAREADEEQHHGEDAGSTALRGGGRLVSRGPDGHEQPAQQRQCGRGDHQVDVRLHVLPDGRVGEAPPGYADEYGRDELQAELGDGRGDVGVGVHPLRVRLVVESPGVGDFLGRWLMLLLLLCLGCAPAYVLIVEVWVGFLEVVRVGGCVCAAFLSPLFIFPVFLHLLLLLGLWGEEGEAAAEAYGPHERTEATHPDLVDARPGRIQREDVEHTEMLVARRADYNVRNDGVGSDLEGEGDDPGPEGRVLGGLAQKTSGQVPHQRSAAREDRESHDQDVGDAEEAEIL